MKAESSDRLAPSTAARDAGLTYVSWDDLTIRRVAETPGPRYRDAMGRAVKAPEILARIKSLALPPAWRDVRICPSPRGHLQAVGTDARGRRQYRYHPQWREVRDQSKYQHVVAFARALPRIRRQVDRDLRRHALNRRKVLATVVCLLESTLIRVGNEEYARQNGSFGLSTMRDRHVAVRGSTVQFRFRGKSGRKHSIHVTNQKLARVIRRLQDLPGQRLFQYVNGEGRLHDVESSDVNAYLREISGADFTAKDFRTWAGTVIAAASLREMERFDGQAHAKRNLLAAIEQTAAHLGNTAAICRRCYIHPEVFAAYLDGSLARVTEDRVQDRMQSPSSLRPEEAVVLALLQRRLRLASRESSPRSPGPDAAGGGRRRDQQRMPRKSPTTRARQDAREGKSPSTQAGEFVRDEIENVRKGRHGVRSAKQAIAIGLSKARRAGVDLPPPAKGSASTKRKARQDHESAGRKPSARRSAASTQTLQRESSAPASSEALSRQAKSAARKRSPSERSASAKKAARTRAKK